MPARSNAARRYTGVMIRRQLATDPPRWLLISQREHARLAGVIAEHWVSSPASTVAVRDIVVPTIFRHDDGWKLWEDSPDVHADTGRPLSFLETSTETSHQLWTASIDGVSDLGPLAQYMVAAHFVHLRRRSGDAESAESQRFIGDYESRCASWLAEWKENDPSSNTDVAAQHALSLLQLLDRISLWICMDDRRVPHSFQSPGGEDLTLTPVAPGQFTLTPCRLDVARLSLEVSGVVVPLRHYTNPSDLARTAKSPMTCSFQIMSARE